VVCSAGRHGGRGTGNPDESDEMRWTEEDGSRHGRKEGQKGRTKGGEEIVIVVNISLLQL
jgi:hypothetical protein